jgi:uncharacterized protein (DUF1697 family)
MRYVALLRGIGPSNPNMRGEKLAGVFKKLGFKNVHTVIASGNVVFDSSKGAAVLEEMIEAALPKELGFKSTTIVRSRAGLEALAKKDPFKRVKDERPNYLVVTFFKDRRKELCTVIDLDAGPTPQFMTNIEKKYGKELTTRTWKTVHRILKKMDEV